MHAQEEQETAVSQDRSAAAGLRSHEGRSSQQPQFPSFSANYKFAMEQFITWYCSEPRLALNRAVVLRFRLYLESLGLAAGTINQRLAVVRRLCV